MRLNQLNIKPVNQYLENRSTLINSYSSLNSAAKHIGCTIGHITKCISEKRLVQNKWWFEFSKNEIQI